jgi:regulator of protease activity HflC (stomatin/prohibitin superfamily)
MRRPAAAGLLGRDVSAAERQETVTRDSVTVKLNAVLWYQIKDAGKSVIAVSDPAERARTQAQ